MYTSSFPSPTSMLSNLASASGDTSPRGPTLVSTPSRAAPFPFPPLYLVNATSWAIRRPDGAA